MVPTTFSIKSSGRERALTSDFAIAGIAKDDAGICCYSFAFSALFAQAGVPSTVLATQSR